MNSTELYRTIWRWHFYAGLFVIPLILILATTGAIICSSHSWIGGRKVPFKTCRKRMRYRQTSSWMPQ
ncbi:MAG: PepSY domain-containing protein [Sphingomonadales bacterium]|nr:PepSY domain-containing protein [Sphingomonadales bacterium]